MTSPPFFPRHIILDLQQLSFAYGNWGRRGRDRMVVEFATTYAIDAYHHYVVSAKSRCTTLCDIVCQ
jgi:hypothetical protein